MNIAYAMVALLVLGVAAFGLAALALLISMLRTGPAAVPVPVRHSPPEVEPQPVEARER